MRPGLFLPLTLAALIAVPALAQESAAPSVAAVSRQSSVAYRTDEIELSLSPSGPEGDELDYMVRMEAGEALVYSWSVEGLENAEDFYSDFNSSSHPPPGVEQIGPLTVVSHKAATGVASGAGLLIAPFDGIHGWFFKNDSLKPVTVKLKLAGFYDLLTVMETMGITGPAFLPFGPAGWADRDGPVQRPAQPTDEE